MSPQSRNLQQQANASLKQGRYDEAVGLYEQAIEADPNLMSNYWYLGLALLLQGQEEEAQAAWMMAMMEGNSEQIKTWTTELIEVLQAEAKHQELQNNPRMAWAIRQHIRELKPDNIDNLIQLTQLEIELEQFAGNELREWHLIEGLQSSRQDDFKLANLTLLVQKVLKSAPQNPNALKLVTVYSNYINDGSRLFDILLPSITWIAYTLKHFNTAIDLVKICLNLDSKNFLALACLTLLYQDSDCLDLGIECARSCYSAAATEPEKINANYLLIRGLIRKTNYWSEIEQAVQNQQRTIDEFDLESSIYLKQSDVGYLITSTFFLPYVRDSPSRNRMAHNKISKACQINLQNWNSNFANFLVLHRPTRSNTINVGYLSYCFRKHSVGWLARWIFKYHDRKKFKIHCYSIDNRRPEDSIQNWYVENADYFHSYWASITDLKKVANQIHQDNIDILVDLDSLTLNTSSKIMALKPAPIQVTWLGWDASGIPAIDYFIADPYVLPDAAQEYYAETIWRLPQTYIAVDGFEVGVPTQNRERLELPENAIVYFTTQKIHKLNPNIVRQQLKIVQQVSNSYLLVKSIGYPQAIQDCFVRIAEEEGVNRDRLRFLPLTQHEAEHRANLAIADVVLDTYPYNGATTTLETLWVGVPLVTRVGEQFSSRNSYTMMTNAGISEGIARTDEEYIEWGVRLGHDPQLRQQIAWKLRQSRQTSPLWNGEQFTREMENAYEQMWQRYLESR